MELKDLKKTWEKMSAGRELDENQLREMLSKRTKSLIERIDRNIKIGFLVLFVLILLFAFDDFVLSPQLVKNMTQGVNMPNWVVFLGVFANTLIITTFIYFVIKYYRVKRSCDVVCELRETAKKIMDTLVLYQRLFYLALVTFMVAVGLSFVSGLYEGVNANIQDQGAQLADIDTQQLILIIVIGILVLSIIVGGIFIFLRWGFRRLYGNYINRLKTTLQELDELDEE
jgi:heme/copper-type cytochrome/quinol oxidase subunit 2